MLTVRDMLLLGLKFDGLCSAPSGLHFGAVQGCSSWTICPPMHFETEDEVSMGSQGQHASNVFLSASSIMRCWVSVDTATVRDITCLTSIRLI